MPGIDGVEALKMIRQFESTVPIYIVTAFHQEYFHKLESVRKEGLSFELLRKPLERDQIQDITKNILGD